MYACKNNWFRLYKKWCLDLHTNVIVNDCSWSTNEAIMVIYNISNPKLPRITKKRKNHCRWTCTLHWNCALQLFACFQNFRFLLFLTHFVWNFHEEIIDLILWSNYLISFIHQRLRKWLQRKIPSCEKCISFCKC